MPSAAGADFDPNLAPLGTPEYWLANYGLTSPSFSVQEVSDDDGDGHTSGDEWRAGTDPTNAASVLSIAELTHTPTSSVIAWHSVAERSYDILFATNSPASPAIPIATAIPGSPPLNTYTTAPTGASGFYRIRTTSP